MPNGELEVYVYEGKAGEIIPESAQHLIVKDSVQTLPDGLCCDYDRLRKVTFPHGLFRIDTSAFHGCTNLLEINKIPVTVHTIGSLAFFRCDKLKDIEFEDDNGTSAKHIGSSAFNSCRSVNRVKLPSSVSLVGRFAFCGCVALIEANLSATCILQIPLSAFANCNSLQTVSLPKTLERICESAFLSCRKLVTVVVPLDSLAITVERGSFFGCKQLVNIQLPKFSTAYEDPFGECDILQERYGEESIFEGLLDRYDSLPVHRMCYDHSEVTTQELRQYIVAQEDESVNWVVDKFGISPLHVFFSTSEPSGELLDVLLESLPKQVLHYKDVNHKRPLDYLVANWTDVNASLFQITVQKWVIDRLARWGATSWMETIERKVKEILTEDDKERKAALSDGLVADFEHYTNVEATSILELALWKVNLRSSGSEVVVPNVWKFLRIAPQAPTTTREN